MNEKELINHLNNIDFENSNIVYNEIEKLIKENQELKEKLDKYENPEDMTLYSMWCTEKIKDENQELKKQLEEYKEQVHKGLYNVCLPYKTGYNKAIKDKEIQQKEFVNYLENMLDDENDIFSVVRVKDVLSKFKEIIGVSDENN